MCALDVHNPGGARVQCSECFTVERNTYDQQTIQGADSSRGRRAAVMMMAGCADMSQTQQGTAVGAGVGALAGV